MEYRRACRYVMSVADVIGATPSMCAEERIYLGSHPNLVIIDEAGKVMEMFLLSVFAYFPYCRRFIIAGDTKQNRAHQGSLTAANCHFDRQSKVSILERALITGAARIFQNHQHRQISALNKLPNEKWYDGTLTTDSAVDDIPEAIQFRQVMKGMFGLMKNLVFLDVAGTSAVRIGKNPSLFNYGQLRLAAHVIVDLLRANFSTSDIVFMAPYIQQISMMRRALLDLSRTSTLSSLELEKVSCISYDTMQGMEANIIVTTLTVTKRIGFLRDRRRLNTEATRPRFGHVIIGASRDMETDKAYRGSAVKDIVDFCRENHLRKSVDLEKMKCVHIPSVNVEERSFVDRSARVGEAATLQTETPFDNFKKPTRLSGNTNKGPDLSDATWNVYEGTSGNWNDQHGGGQEATQNTFQAWENGGQEATQNESQAWENGGQEATPNDSQAWENHDNTTETEADQNW